VDEFIYMLPYPFPVSPKVGAADGTPAACLTVTINSSGVAELAPACKLPVTAKRPYVPVETSF
jgi:hypothetical protein